MGNVWRRSAIHSESSIVRCGTLRFLLLGSNAGTGSGQPAGIHPHESHTAESHGLLGLGLRLRLCYFIRKHGRSLLRRHSSFRLVKDSLLLSLWNYSVVPGQSWMRILWCSSWDCIGHWVGRKPTHLVCHSLAGCTKARGLLHTR